MKDQWIEWLQGKHRNFFYGVSIVVAVFFIAFQLTLIFQKPTRSHYLTTHLAFEKWMMHDKGFDDLKTALATNPELETKFGALIADKFIKRNDGENAKPFAEAVLQRVLKQTPEHTSYAEGSLLISQGNLTQALDHSTALGNRLEKNSLLYGFNLFRIASLHRALNHSAEERASLEELRAFIVQNPKAHAVLEQSFSEDQNSLSDYITKQLGN